MPESPKEQKLNKQVLQSKLQKMFVPTKKQSEGEQMDQLLEISNIDQIEETFDSFEQLNNLDVQIGVEDVNTSKNSDKIKKAVSEDLRKMN